MSAHWKELDRNGKVGAVYRLAKQRLTATEIGDRLGTTSGHVNTLARREGIAITKAAVVKAQRAEAIGAPAKVTGDIWSRSEDEKRAAIIARAAKGARQRLDEIAREDARQSSYPQVSHRQDKAIDFSPTQGIGGLDATQKGVQISSVGGNRLAPSVSTDTNETAVLADGTSRSTRALGAPA